jgi:hypothetical protein
MPYATGARASLRLLWFGKLQAIQTSDSALKAISLPLDVLL